jgi:hypothetical protein
MEGGKVTLSQKPDVLAEAQRRGETPIPNQRQQAEARYAPLGGVHLT